MRIKTLKPVYTRKNSDLEIRRALEKSKRLSKDLENTLGFIPSVKLSNPSPENVHALKATKTPGKEKFLDKALNFVAEALMELASFALFLSGASEGNEIEPAPQPAPAPQKAKAPTSTPQLKKQARQEPELQTRKGPALPEPKGPNMANNRNRIFTLQPQLLPTLQPANAKALALKKALELDELRRQAMLKKAKKSSAPAPLALLPRPKMF